MAVLEIFTDKNAVTDPTGNGVLDAAGEEIVYTITVTNGSDPGAANNFQTVTLSDTKLGLVNVDVESTAGITISGDIGNDGVLSPGETWTLTGDALVYETTQADFDHGGAITNTASVATTTAAGVALTASSSLTTTVEQNPDFTITKTVTSVTGGTPDNEVDSAGDVINYAIVIHNTGNMTLTGVTVTDQVESYGATDATYVSGDVDNDLKLDVGEAWTYSASYTVTQDDLDNNGGGDGDIDNIATGDADQVGPKTDTEVVPLITNPDFTITKTVTSVTGGTADNTVDSVGDVINYAIVIDNTGNVTLTGVTVTDQVESYGATDATYVSGDADNDLKLDVDEAWTYSASYAVTQADIDNNGGGDGDIDNIATGDTDQVGPKTDDAVVPIVIPPEVCYDGLTPGFWKNDQNWRKVTLDDDCTDEDGHLGQYADANYDGAAGISTADIMYTVTLGEVFGFTGQYANTNLVTALGLNGNQNGEAFIRQATAALLNACVESHQDADDGFDYLLSPEQVVELVGDVLAASNFKAAAEELKADFEYLNQLEVVDDDANCPTAAELFARFDANQYSDIG